MDFATRIGLNRDNEYAAIEFFGRMAENFLSPKSVVGAAGDKLAFHTRSYPVKAGRIMRFKGLILTLIISAQLVGCDHPRLRNMSLAFGLTEPEYSDIQYKDEYLDALFKELHSLDTDTILISDEYNWIKSMSKLCEKTPSARTCLDEENIRHRSKLQSILVEKLVSFSLVDEKVDSLNLPTDMSTLSAGKPRRSSAQLSSPMRLKPIY